ncbi:MAG: response regulator [Balneolaceae bacterium]|nr:response regulator [Balneolaceae bacterium]
MNYKVLVIDDDEPIHIITKNLLGKEFTTLHARDVQEAIDILSEKNVNLVLSDIHMPGISGLEFLESLRLDEHKKKIPVLIMTNLPTVEKEQKALKLGAADFIKKELFNNNKEKVLEAVRMKIVTDIQIPGLDEELDQKKNKLVMKIMEKAIDGSFDDTVQTLADELSSILNAGFTGFWAVDNDSTTLIYNKGKFELPENASLAEEDTFLQLQDTQQAYFTNHIYNEDVGFFVDFSKEHSLSAEIGVPIYSVNERMLLMNNMKVPADADMFGVLLVKRSVLFSSAEFELVSRLSTQAGSILFRLYEAD